MDDPAAGNGGGDGKDAKVRCAVFDFDNTLLQSEELKRKVMLDVCKDYPGGLEIIAGVNTDARVSGVKCTRYTIFSDFAQGLSDRGYQPPGGGSWTVTQMGQELADRFSQDVEASLVKAAEVPGAFAMLQHFHAQHLPVYINSATPGAPLKDLVDKLGWSPYVKEVLGAAGSKCENLEAVAKREGLAPGEVVHVGDGNNDCEAAQQFGCRFVGVHADPATAFTGPVHRVVSDMHQACSAICELALVPDKHTHGASSS